jgi:DNA-binding response OmpR family regulator
MKIAMSDDVYSGPEVPGIAVRVSCSARSEILLAEGLLDLARGVVRYPDGGSCLLSAREAELLRYLAENAGRVVTRDEILQRVWGLNPMRILTRVIDMHIVHLRGKLRDRRRPRVLRTVHGRGYMFVAD